MSKLFPGCKRCEDWERQGLSATCPACDMAEQRKADMASNQSNFQRPNKKLGDSDYKLVRGYFTEDSEFIVTKTLGAEYNAAPEMLAELKQIQAELLEHGTNADAELASRLYRIIAKAEENNGE